MNIHTVFRAYQALEAMSRNEGMTAREAYGIMKLKSSLREDAAFYAERRNELLIRYGKADDETPGKYNFPDKEAFEAYSAALRELEETETHVRVATVTLRGENTGVTPDMLEALDGFVTVE